MENLVINSQLEKVLAPVNLVDAGSLFKNENIQLPRGYSKAVKSGDKIYGFVSDNFGLIKPADVYETFSEQFDKLNLKFDVEGRIDNRGNYQLRWVFTNEEVAKLNKIVKDAINAMFAFMGGLAGSQRTQLKNMASRKICMNGMTITELISLMTAVRNTKNNHATKFGIDFELLMPLVLEFVNSHEFIKEQTKLIDMELKSDQILPFFYEATKGTKYPESKFQSAFDRMKLEASELGYTEMNRYLAYAGLNYILEHDSMAMNLVQTNELDSHIAGKVQKINIGNAVKNFNQIVRTENERISSYSAANDGKLPRGKRKVLELV